MTRKHPGNSAPENPALELFDPRNRYGTCQGAFRAGDFDAVTLRYAVEITGGLDGVAHTR